MNRITIPAPENWRDLQHLVREGRPVRLMVRLPDAKVGHTYMVDDVNDRSVTASYQGTHELMTLGTHYDVAPFYPAELSAALDKLGLNATEFGRLLGVGGRAVQRWLGDGDEPRAIPPSIRTVCVLLTLPGALAKARLLADAVAKPKVRQ